MDIKQEIADAEKVIAGLNQQIRCIQTDMDRPELVEKDVRERREVIAMHERIIARRLDNRVNGALRIAVLREDIAKCHHRVRQLRAKTELDKLSVMVAEANELQSQAYGKGLVDHGQGKAERIERDVERATGDFG